MKLLRNYFFVKIFLSVTILFVLFHATIWIGYTSKIFDRDDGLYIGDLGRVSYQLDSLHPRKLEYTLEKRHLHRENWNFEQVDILTVGDSFSNADTGGLNPYYQDYLATFYDKKVLNLQRFSDKSNSMQLLISLYNSGWLERYKPKYIVLEAVERFSLEMHSTPMDWDATLKGLDNSILADFKTTNSYIPELSFINTANYNFILYSLEYKFLKVGHKWIPRLKLNQPLFTPENYKDFLLFTNEDIRNHTKQDDKRVHLLNENLNRLSKLLQTLDIKLFYMIASDKYDLYYDFIVDNPYPKNYLFDLLRETPKEYYFVDTKTILLEALKRGEKDIYYADDTHWSYRASEIISQDSIFKENIR